MKISVIYFIGQCLTLDEHPTFRETIITQFSDPDYDWNTFIWTCSNHLVLPVIYLKFKKHDLLGYLPEVLAQHLEEIYTLNRSRNEQIILQVKEINVTLKRADISPLFMKGTGNLIDGIYGDIGERIIGDIDFLVPEADFLTAAELFQKEGYAMCIPTNIRSDQKRYHHYPRLWKENVIADIEIHRQPVIKKYEAGFSADLVLQSKKVVANYSGCYVPCDEHKIIHNFVHSQLTNAGHRLGVVSLRDIYDLYLLSKRADLTTVLPQTQSPQKALAYFEIANLLLGLPISDKKSLTSKFFLWKHRLNLSSPIFNRTNRIFWMISWVVVNGFFKQIKEVIIYKDERNLLLKNLMNKNWYAIHFKFYKKMITG